MILHLFKRKVNKPIIVFYEIIPLEKYFLIIDYRKNIKTIKEKVRKDNNDKYKN